MPPSRWRTAWRPREVIRRRRPGADPHRARRQGLGVAGGGGATPERPGVPVDGVDAHLAHRRRRPAAAAARRPRHRIRARRPGARHVRRQRSKAPVGQDLRSQTAASSSAASTRSAGCCTWRSPAPRTPCCCRVTIGAPPRPNPAAPPISSASSRTSSRRPKPLAIPAASSNIGHRRRPMVSRTRCATGQSKRSGRPTRSARRGETWTTARRW